MPHRGQSLSDSTSHAGGAGGASALARIDAACRQAVAGKLALRELVEWVRAHGVSECEFRLLWLLFRSGRQSSAGLIPQADLAQHLAVSAAQISGAVERLQAASLVDGVRDREDRRRQLWRLDAAGQSLVLGIAASVEARSGAVGRSPVLRSSPLVGEDWEAA
jgi:DNA-binding MarR family transcriptional regulator